MVADVPVGAFLSGGVDSSLVVALAQAAQSSSVRTFTIGFDEHGFDEASHARAIAEHLHTDHTELYVSPADALAIVPDLPTMYDEPFADSSQLPTHLVSRLAREHVTVSVSGDAGDELFGGYSRYQLYQQMWRWLGRVPRPVRSSASSLVRRRPASWWTGRIESVARLLPQSLQQQRSGDKLHKLARILDVRNEQDAYRVLMSQWHNPASVVPGARELPTALTDPSVWLAELPLASRPRLVDQLQYLPDDILVKVDRASMAVSLEARVPLLDHRVVELAWRLPPEILYRDGRGKWPLRALLERHVPLALFDRPKKGFSVPIGAWLRGPLHGWAEDLLQPARLRDGGLLDERTVRTLWSSHLAGGGDDAGGYDLWAVLMLQAWLAAAG
jgi:asparagine synthase (glutamine-hydrolysing)